MVTRVASAPEPIIARAESSSSMTMFYRAAFYRAAVGFIPESLPSQ
jgi:hypothetical protein